MNFDEALEELKKGNRVYRKVWVPEFTHPFFLEMDELGEIKAFQELCREYTYDNTILMSEGWKVLEDDIEVTFIESISYLRQGKTTRFKEWKTQFLRVDQQTNMLLVWDNEESKFSPSYKCLIANDWELFQGEDTWKSIKQQVL